MLISLCLTEQASMTVTSILRVLRSLCLCVGTSLTVSKASMNVIFTTEKPVLMCRSHRDSDLCPGDADQPLFICRSLRHRDLCPAYTDQPLFIYRILNDSDLCPADADHPLFIHDHDLFILSKLISLCLSAEASVTVTSVLGMLTSLPCNITPSLPDDR
jgi:hypothetical protein